MFNTIVIDITDSDPQLIERLKEPLKKWINHHVPSKSDVEILAIESDVPLIPVLQEVMD